MPSTPVDSPFDLSADINSPDRTTAPYFLRNQQIKNILSTADVFEQQNQRIQKSFKMLNISTPDSSQTDHSSADDVSPKIQRRRKNLIAAAAEEDYAKKHILPKLSISVEHEPSQLLPSPTIQAPSPIASTSHAHLNKRVLKSASAIDLSLKIQPNYVAADRLLTDNVRRAKLKLETNFGEKSRMGSDLELDMALAKSLNSSGGNGSSTASSREVSPSRDGPLINHLKPP